MDSDADSAERQTPGLPFVRPIVRRLTEELFREQPQWKSRDLVDRIVQVHRERGGAPPSNPAFAVRRVLRDLKDEGVVAAPGHGWWRLSGAATDEVPITHEETTDNSTISADALDDLEPILRIEKETGVGSECVYLYFNPNDRRLAELECRDVWECKIGRTSSCDAIGRILGQGIRTALSRLPTVGLVLRTDDSAALENALHSSLRLVGAEVPDSPGNEWFYTSPARVEAWHASFQSSLAEISPAHADSG